MPCLFLGMSIIAIGVGLAFDTNEANLGGVIPESIIMILCIYLLFINEGYQVGLLGIQDLALTEMEGFSTTHAIHRFMFEKGNKMPRLFIGRSVLVVLSTFLIAQLTTFPTFPAVQNEGLQVIIDVFVKTGFCGMIVTVNLAQLLPSILAQSYPREFLNKIPFSFAIIYLALCIESIGILQITYSLVYIITRLACESKATNPYQKPPFTCNRALRVIKSIFSGILTLGCMGFLMYNISNGHSILTTSIPLAFIFLLIPWLTMFYAEGIKIAIISSSTLEIEELVHQDYPLAIMGLVSENEGIPRFLLGRQMLVVPMGFLLANVTLFKGWEYLPDEIYIPLIALGLPGMIVTMQCFKLAPQIIASRHNKAFLKLPGTYLFVLFALCIEKLGFTKPAFLLKHLIQRFVCRQSLNEGERVTTDEELMVQTQVANMLVARDCGELYDRVNSDYPSAPPDERVTLV
jgi:hypothetical protein